jgi:hypothetical protein
MLKNTMLIFWVLLLAGSGLRAGETTRPVFFPSVRSQGMGGTGVVSAVGTFAYQYNPAFLATGESNFTLAGVQVGLSSDFFNVINYMIDYSDDFKKFDSDYQPKITAQESDSLIECLRREAASLDNIWYRGNLLPSIGLNYKNFAIGLYNISHLGIRPDVGLVVPKFQIQVYNDLVVACGYGKQYLPNLALGVNLKIIRRFETDVFKIQVEEVNALNDTWKEGEAELKQGVWGYGLDLGALYQVLPNLKFGVTAQDFLGKIDGINTPFCLKLGVLMQPVPALQLAAEWNDFLNHEGEKLFNKIHLGAEYRIPVVRFRLGIHQGYPTVGFGVDLRFIQLNYTYFEDEITTAPGQQSESAHLMDLQVNLF